MPAGRPTETKFYVYRIYDGHETVYVGKGSGRRLRNQMRSFGMTGEVLEYCISDDHAFEREIHWIKKLLPTLNKVAGGNGGRCLPKVLTAEQKKADREYRKFLKEYEAIGPKSYVAEMLCRLINLGNCEANGISKVEWFRLRDVANGEWC